MTLVRSLTLFSRTWSIHQTNISPHFQNTFFFQKTWFDLISDYFIVPCTSLEFLFDLHCHSHNYSKTDFVIKSNQNWSSKNGCQNHYFSWWLCVTTLSHEWLLHLLSKKTDFDDWTYQIWNLNLVWMSFFFK